MDHREKAKVGRNELLKHVPTYGPLTVASYFLFLRTGEYQPTGTNRQTSCVLQCGELCDETSDSISSIERWENMKEKALLWRPFSNTTKLENLTEKKRG